VTTLAYYTRVRGFDSHTVLFVCMNMSVCIGSGCFDICIYKRKLYKYVFIRYLEYITQALEVLTLDKMIVSVSVKNIIILHTYTHALSPKG
jgi:hypothetical protein